MKYNTPKEYKHTSIMHEIKSDKFVPEIKLLFTDYADRSNKLVQKIARHDFWQMEFILEGNVLVCFDKSKITLSEKQILIIPPGIKHHFVYNGPRKTWSFKFNLYPELPEDLQILPLPRKNDNAQNLYNVLFQLLAEYKQIPTSLYDTFEYLLGGIIVMNYAKNEDKEKIPEWASAAKEFITVNIENDINLEDLAEHLNYTRIHLSRLCKMHLNMKLKDFFDQEKVSIITKKLLYSHKNITEIAQETGFKDVYSFSRFYKRVIGLTPSAQRRS